MKTGKLTINGGFSRLGSTRMMKGAINNGGFGRATVFLQQDRQLNSGETIWVDGTDNQFGGMPVIVITDAGRAVPAVVALGAGAELIAVDASKAAVKAVSAGSKKGAKASTKKSAKKSAKKPAANKAAKKSTKKQSGK